MILLDSLDLKEKREKMKDERWKKKISRMKRSRGIKVLQENH